MRHAPNELTPSTSNIQLLLGYVADLELKVEQSGGTVPAAARVLAESDEALVADPRGGLTPAQMVDQMLVARLHTGHPGLVLQATGRPQDVRRLPR